MNEHSPVDVLNKVGAMVDALEPANAEVVINLAIRMQHMVKDAGSLGVLALSLCSASITAGLQVDALKEKRIVVAGSSNDPRH